MKILALVIAIYALAMVVLHVSTSAILRAWKERPGSWISRRFPARRALRTEALFWLLALVALPLWQPLAWKLVIIVFAVIHLGVWLGGELTLTWTDPSALTQTATRRRAVVAFDLVEAVVLAAAGVFAAVYLIHGA